MDIFHYFLRIQYDNFNRLKLKDIQFTSTEDKANQKIFTFEKLEPMNSWHKNKNRGSIKIVKQFSAD